MVWKVILSDFMKIQVTTLPPEDGFENHYKAYTWVLKNYGSTAIDSTINGQDVGCHIVEY
jgi:hypothetical protein